MPRKQSNSKALKPNPTASTILGGQRPRRALCLSTLLRYAAASFSCTITTLKRRKGTELHAENKMALYQVFFGVDLSTRCQFYFWSYWYRLLHNCLLIQNAWYAGTVTAVTWYGYYGCTRPLRPSFRTLKSDSQSASVLTYAPTSSFYIHALRCCRAVGGRSLLNSRLITVAFVCLVLLRYPSTQGPNAAHTASVAD